MMLILTGEKGCGKTSLLKELLLTHNVPAQGFLSIKEVTDGEVTGISLLILPGKRSFRMATTSPVKTAERTSRFYFYPKVFALVNRHFHHIMPDLPFVFDEFGKFEMDQKGHFPIFEILKKTRHQTLVIARSNIVDLFISSYCTDVNYSMVDLDKCDGPQASQSILDFLTGKSKPNLS